MGFLEPGTACGSAYGSAVSCKNQGLKSGSRGSAFSLSLTEKVTSLQATAFPFVTCPAHLKGFEDNPIRERI